MNFSSDTLNKFSEILSMQPSDVAIFNFGIIVCHLGDNGKYIEIYDNSEKLISKLQLSLYDNANELGYDICDLIFNH